MDSDGVNDAVAQYFTRYGGRTSKVKSKQERMPLATGLHILDDLGEKSVALGDLIDVIGASSSGKTRILHSITAEILSNTTSDDKPKVCWYDLNGGLNINLLRSHFSYQRGNNASEKSDMDPLNSLLVYYPESTLAMCASLQALLKYLQTPDGALIKAVIIDALGMFHYVDRYRRESRKEDKSTCHSNNEDYVLIQILRDLLAMNRVTIFVSKCALYDDEKLSIPWPFPNAGIPSIPQDFMPSAWLSIVTHSLVLYKSSGEKNCSKNESHHCAVLVLTHMDGQKRLRQGAVAAATTIALSRFPCFSQGEIYRP